MIVCSQETSRYSLASVSKQLRSKVDGSMIRLERYFIECTKMQCLSLFQMGLYLVREHDDWVSDIVCKHGWGEALQLLISVGFRLSENCLSEAIDSGSTWVIKLLLQHGKEPNISTVAKCARRGSLQTIRLLVGAADRSIVDGACAWAAAAGRDDALWLLLTMGCPVGRALEEAIAADSVECLKELDRNGYIYDAEMHNLRVRAAQNSLISFKYFTTGVHHIELSPDTAYIYDAVCNGNVACAEYLHRDIGAPLVSFLVNSAIENKQKKTLRWLVSLGADIDEDAMWHAARAGFSYIEILVDAGVQCTAERLEEALTWCTPVHPIVRKLVEKGVELTQSMVMACVYSDDIDTFRLLLELGCPAPNTPHLVKRAVEHRAVRIFFATLALYPDYRVSWHHLSFLTKTEEFELQSYKEQLAAAVRRAHPRVGFTSTANGKIEWTMSTDTMGFIVSKLGWNRFKALAECLQS